MFAAVGADLPFHLEILVRVYRPILGRQVADVPVRGQHGEILAQILVDGFGLGRRFDYDNAGHVHLVYDDEQ